MLVGALSFLPLALAVSVRPREGAQDYKGWQVHRVNGDSNTIAKLVSGSLHSFDRWESKSGTDGFVDYAISPADLNAFKALGLNSQVMHSDLGAAIEGEKTFSTFAFNQVSAAALPAESWFDSYHSYADHVNYWKQLNAGFANNSNYFVTGKSYEGRDIFGLKIFGSGSGTKPAIIWHANVHAREWITSMTAEYITYNIINGYLKNDATYKAMLDKYDIYIIPFVNPDGFVYTQTTNRLWRKNREPSRTSGLTGLIKAAACVGTDVNRNWPYKWDGAGSSTDPCDETYRGPSAGSSPENKAVVAHARSVAAKQKIVNYIDIHSYSQLILTPYGYDCAARPVNNDQQISLAKRMEVAIENAYQTSWTSGPSCSTIYQTAGSSSDWFSDIVSTTVSLAMELRDTGRYGFVLPPSQIRPAGIETLAGIRTLIAGL